MAELCISIHAAREGGDDTLESWCKRTYKFQSTPPVKAATVKFASSPVTSVFQSTPPVKAATWSMSPPRMP